MRPNETFVGQPIRSLQTMLRFIAESDNRQPSVIPDGFYTQDTVRAVSAFQRRAGLPVTGVTDQATWDAIVPVYQDARIQVSPAQPLRIILDPGAVIRRGEHHPNLYLVQSMLLVLSQAYGSIPAPNVTGTLDIPTAEAISVFQQLCLLPATGELDKRTWKHLALQYPLAANRLTRTENREKGKTLQR